MVLFCMANHSCGSGGCSPTGRDLRRAPASGEVVNRPCCGGRDLGPLEEHEGPSADDIARFGDDVTQTCPKCKSEMYDDAAMCWKCGHALMGTDRAKPVPKWMMIGAAAACVGFILMLVLR